MLFKPINRNNVIIERKLARGSFADIFAALDFSTSQPLAIKVERHPCAPSTIEAEITTLRALSEVNSVPKVLWAGQINNKPAFIMPLLGQSLADQIPYKKCLSLQTISALATEMLNILEGIHSKGVLHLDLKPSNILFSQNSSQIYLIDFNLSKSFLSPSGEHLPLSPIGEFNGNVQFASLNAHQLLEQSRRDDLESLGYLLLSLCTGGLEWDRIDEVDPIKRIIAVGEEKSSFLKTVKKNAAVPKFLRKYFSFVNEIGFYDKPNYQNLRQLFSDSLFSKKLEKQVFETKAAPDSKRTSGDSTNWMESSDGEGDLHGSNFIKKKETKCMDEYDYGNFIAIGKSIWI